MSQINTTSLAHAYTISEQDRVSLGKGQILLLFLSTRERNSNSSNSDKKDNTYTPNEPNALAHNILLNNISE